MSEDIKGIGDSGAPEGWVIVEKEEPMPPGGIDPVLESMRAILSQKRIQSIKLELGKPIRYTRFVPRSEAEQQERVEEKAGMQLGEIARNVMMEEYTGKEELPAKILVDLMLQIESRHLFLSYVGVGAESRLITWLGLDPIAYGGIGNLCGVPLRRDRDVPDNVLIFLGSPYRSARMDQVTYAIKAHMFLPGEDLPAEESDE